MLSNFTQNYLNKLNAVTNASVNFEAQPCRATAIVLTEAKIELEKVEIPSLKFTPEFRLAEKNKTIASIRECMVNIINN